MISRDEKTFSIYVGFRGRRLSLRRACRSLEDAQTFAARVRRDRFRDDDSVYIVCDQTGEREPLAGPPQGARERAGEVGSAQLTDVAVLSDQAPLLSIGVRDQQPPTPRQLPGAGNLARLTAQSRELVGITLSLASNLNRTLRLVREGRDRSCAAEAVIGARSLARPAAEEVPGPSARGRKK